MFERFTDGARQVVVLAQEEARRLNHAHIGTEHLLLALVSVPDTVAARALGSLGLTPEKVRRQVDTLAEPGTRSPDTHLPFSVRGKRALELSLREALDLQHQYIGTEHLLLGILREGDGAAVRVLVSLGVQIPDLRERTMELLAASPDTPDAARGSIAPRCPHCDAAAADNLRARTTTIDGPSATQRKATLVSCGSCGAVLGVLPA